MTRSGEKEGGGKWHLFSEMMHPSSASVVKSRYEKVSTADRFAQLPPLARCYSQIQEVLEDVSFKTQLESERLRSWFEKTIQEHEIHRMHEELTRFHGINCAASYQGSRRKCCDGVKANVDFFCFFFVFIWKGWLSRIRTGHSADHQDCISNFLFNLYHLRIAASRIFLPNESTNQIFHIAFLDRAKKTSPAQLRPADLVTIQKNKGQNATVARGTLATLHVLQNFQF